MESHHNYKAASSVAHRRDIIFRGFKSYNPNNIIWFWMSDSFSLMVIIILYMKPIDTKLQLRQLKHGVP